MSPVSARDHPLLQIRSSSAIRVQIWGAVGTVVVMLVLVMPTAGTHDPLALVLQIACCLLAGIAVLRPVPAGALLAICLVLVFFTTTHFLGLAVLALPLVLIGCAARGHRLAAIIYTAWYFIVSVLLTLEASANAELIVRGVIIWLIFMLMPLLLGEIIRHVVQGSERQRREAARAAQEERLTIARELHDTLAYATTTMVMKAEEARLRGGHDPETLADLDYIARTGRNATTDLRAMMMLLRGQNPESVGTASVRGLRDEVAKLEEFGFTVESSIEGDIQSLPEGVQMVLLKVVGEGTSNIAKHGDPTAPAQIMVDVGAEEVEAVMANSPGTTGSSENGHRPLGLVGLHELVSAAGGKLTAGLVGDRWVTHLSLPVPAGGHVGA